MIDQQDFCFSIGHCEIVNLLILLVAKQKYVLPPKYEMISGMILILNYGMVAKLITIQNCVYRRGRDINI